MTLFLKRIIFKMYPSHSLCLWYGLPSASVERRVLSNEQVVLKMHWGFWGCESSQGHLTRGSGRKPGLEVLWQQGLVSWEFPALGGWSQLLVGDLLRFWAHSSISTLLATQHEVQLRSGDASLTSRTYSRLHILSYSAFCYKCKGWFLIDFTRSVLGAEICNSCK